VHEDVPTKAIAACFGLAGFIVAIICGLFAANPIEVTLSRAIPAMFVCCVIGYVIGIFTTRAISQNIQVAAEAAAAAATEAAEAAARIAQQEAGPAVLGKAGVKSAQASTPIAGSNQTNGASRKAAA
jgi:hypothetical protein